MDHSDDFERVPVRPLLFPYPSKAVQPTEAQIDKARETLPQFLQELAAPRRSSIHLSVRVPASACGVSGRRYIWLSKLSPTTGGVEGRVAPGEVTAPVPSRRIHVEFKEIIDWLYVNNGRLIGAWTVRDNLIATPSYEFDTTLAATESFVIANEEERATTVCRLFDAIGDFDCEQSLAMLNEPELLASRCKVATQTDSDFELHAYSPMQYAISCENGYVIRRCLQLGVEPSESNVFGFTALHVASFNGWSGLATLALAKGAEIDQPSKTGHTPLACAVACDQHGLARLLLQDGADIHHRTLCASEDGYTSVTSVVCSGFRTKETAAVLLDFGADFSQADHRGYTALHIASLNGDFELAKYLVDIGCSPFQLTNKGESAIDLATKYRDKSLEVEKFIAHCKQRKR